MFSDILLAVVSVLLFPGLVFLVTLSLFTQYLVRKLSARLQKRMGPSYVGPFGLLQPLYDFWKLLRHKELVKTKYSMVRVAEASLIIGIAYVATSVVFLPLSPFNLRSEFDLLIFFYMASVTPLFALVVASLSMPGPYTSIGVSRLLSMVTLAEPAFFASVVIPIYISTRGLSREEGFFMSISDAYIHVQALWSDPRTAVPLTLSFISFLVSVQAKSMYPPFNIPEAEQEVIAGFETEFSGPLLALARLLHDIDLALSIMVGVYVLLGGPAPFRHLSLPGVLMLILKYCAVTIIIVLIKNVMGRYRIEQALVQLFKYGLIPVLVAAALVMLI